MIIYKYLPIRPPTIQILPTYIHLELIFHKPNPHELTKNLCRQLKVILMDLIQD